MITSTVCNHKAILPPIINFPSNYNVNKPNFLLLVVDDLALTNSWSHSSSNGTHLNGKTVKYFDVLTPNIQKTINEGIVFPRTYSSSTFCAPSRYSLLTGKYATRSEYAIDKTKKTTNGIYGTNVSVQVSKLFYNDSVNNIQNILKTYGNYYTCFIGKWHLLTPNDNGYNYGCSNLLNNPNKQLYKNCSEIIKQQGFDFVDAFYYSNIPEVNYVYSHNPEWMIQQTEQCINNAIQNNKPFFIYLSLTLTHTPSISEALMDINGIKYTPKGELIGDEIPYNTGMNTRLNIYNKLESYGLTSTRDKDAFAGLLWVDEMVGTLITYLNINNLYNKTFYIFTNDHGMGVKGLLYEQGTRITQFIRYPPLFGNKMHILNKNKFIVGNVDLAATIFQVANISKINYYKNMDSKSWLNDVINEINSSVSNSNTHSTCCAYRFMDVFNSHAIVTQKYKYIFRTTLKVDDSCTYYVNALDNEQIYNLISDPIEQINIINSNLNEIKDEIFKFRLKMINYIQNIACNINIQNISKCIVPNITYIPQWSNYTLPTPIPTTSIPTTPNPSLSPSSLGMTCNDIINFHTFWRGVKSWTGSTPQERQRLTIAEQNFLNTSVEYNNCGVIGAIEYVYKFEYVQRRLDVDLIICCSGTFGQNYILNQYYPNGFKLNDYITQNYPIIDDDDYDDEYKRDTTIRDFIVIIVVLVCVCAIIIVMVYNRRYIKQRINAFTGKEKKTQTELSLSRLVERGTASERKPLTPTPNKTNRQPSLNIKTTLSKMNVPSTSSVYRRTPKHSM